MPVFTTEVPLVRLEVRQGRQTCLYNISIAAHGPNGVFETGRAI